jgi:hypothetical protein
MIKLISISFLLSATLLNIGCSSYGGQDLSIETNYSALMEVKSIYIDDFGGAEGSDLVREKLLVRLINSGRFNVVENQDRADALLVGSAGVSSRIVNGNTDYNGNGFLRLVEANSQTTIWGHQYQRGFMLGGSVSTRVANQMADQLLEDAGEEL